MLTPISRLAALALVAGLATGCGGAGNGDPSADPEPGGASTRAGDGRSTGSGDGASPAVPAPTTEVDVPDGVTLTDPGTELAFGETARVAYEVTRPAPTDRSRRRGDGGRERKGGAARDDTVTTGTVLALRVDSATKARLADLAGFDLRDRYQRQANYYYVRVTVRNLGPHRLGDVAVPLWGISGRNTLLPPVVFNSAFARCPTEPLPSGFAPGDRLATCLVFLSPDKGSLEGVSFRPTEQSTPVEWRGKVAPPRGKG